MVNTGLRDSELCNLKWSWEYSIPELNTSVFIIPKEHSKNFMEGLVILNRIAASVFQDQRGKNPENVFSYKGRHIRRMLSSAWIKARKRADLNIARVHDLRHTFGRRLRSAGISFEDRQDLLRHKSSRITTHYSKAEIQNLIDASNLITDSDRVRPDLVMIRGNCG